MRVLQGILLSLLIHLLIVWASQYAPLLAPRPTSQPITVDIVSSQDETTPKSQQIVREALVPDKLKVQETEDQLKFLSAQTQRVRQQTKALLSGMTKNRSQQSSAKPPDQPRENASQKSRLDPKMPGHLDAFTPNYRRAPSLPRDLQMEHGLSSIGEALPEEVSVGSFTALNTDRYLFYSFFSRIEELIRFRWESQIRQSIDTTPPERFQTNISGLWNTQLEIWLKPNGEFHSSHLMKEYGFRAFDQATIQAFIQARLFPNPPKEMVESDGLIHLKYAFQVRYEPKVLVKSRE